MHAMPRLLARFLLLIAVLAAPLSMTPASAVGHAGGTDAAMPMPHCPEQQQTPDEPRGIAECAMACAAALPALSASPADIEAAVHAPQSPGGVSLLPGRHLEIATPPPKLS